MGHILTNQQNNLKVENFIIWLFYILRLVSCSLLPEVEEVVGRTDVFFGPSLVLRD